MAKSNAAKQRGIPGVLLVFVSGALASALIYLVASKPKPPPQS